jgi:hypothetical protein
MMAEDDPFIRLDKILAVVMDFAGRGAAVVEHQDAGGDPFGIKAVADGVAAQAPPVRMWMELSRNAETNQVSGRLQFCQGDLFAAVPADARFDLIVSNPPYIPTARIDTLEAEVRDYEPRGALDGGADGQDFYRRIAAEAGARLRPAGCVMVELDDEGAAATGAIFQREKWIVESLEKDDRWTADFDCARGGQVARWRVSNNKLSDE